MKTAKEILKENAPFDYTDEVYYLRSDDALEAMEEYAEQFKPKWISVEDELPELNSRIQVFDGRVEICNYKVDTVFGDRSGKPCFMDEQDEQPGWLLPTHWMPLPEPPNTKQSW